MAVNVISQCLLKDGVHKLTVYPLVRDGNNNYYYAENVFRDKNEGLNLKMSLANYMGSVPNVGDSARIIELKNGNYVTLEYTYHSGSGTNENKQYIMKFYNANNTLFHTSSVLDIYPNESFSGYNAYNMTLTWFLDSAIPNKVLLLISRIIRGNVSGAARQDFTDWFVGTEVPADPYGLQENETPPGGYGGFDYTGDDVDIPALPTISAAASGFVRLYNPTIGEVQSLASYLWSGAFDLATYKKLFGNPMDCFLSFGIIPVTPPRSVNKEAISFANMPDPGVTAYKLTSQFAEFDCGSVTIDSSKYTSSAMDYSPYTKAELFLPFCGTHSLAVDDIMDSTISIKYHMDIYTGACVAYVKITRTNSDGSTLDSVLYQFTGNILATIPLTGADHSNFIQSMLFMGAAVAATVATAGGAAPEIGGAMAVGDSVSTSALGGAAISASGINAVMSMKPNVIRSGNLSANAGFLGLKKPVITLTCPNLCRPEDENKLTGMPCQKSGTLSDFSGFNIIGACHLDNIPCTMEELRMIDAALAKGVIV